MSPREVKPRCLAVPLKLTSVDSGNQTGTVTMAGADLEVGLMLVPDAAPGDYVLVHAGMAIERVDEQDAAEMLETIREYATTDGALLDDNGEPDG